MRTLFAKAAGVLTLAMALLCGPSWATQAEQPGRDYTIDDLLNQAAFGRTTIDPTQRWIVFEQSAPYSEIDRYDLGLFTRASSNVLWIADAAGDGPAERLLPVSEGRGHVLGDWSPSGRRLLIFRLQQDRWSLGVLELATRTVRWLDVHPDAGGYGRVVQWRSEDELVLIDRREDELPFVIGWDPQAEVLTRERWATQASGRAPSLTLMGAGAFSADTPVSPESDLIRLDLRSGAKAVLSTGRFFDLELSPDRDHVAAMTLGSMPPVDQDRPLWPVDKPERRHIRIITLGTGAVVHPCGHCEVAPFLMSWSPDSRRVLVWLTGPNGPVSGDLAAVRPDGGMETFDRFGLEPDVTATRVASFTAVRAVWQGDRPVLRARRGASARDDWHRLEPGRALNLTAAMAAAPNRIDTIDQGDLIGVADGSAWRIGPTGRPTRMSSAVDLRPFAPFDVLDAPRITYNTPTTGAFLLGLNGAGRLEPAGASWPAPRDEGSLVTPVTGSPAQVVEEIERNGVRRLTLRRPDGRVRVLSTLNAYLDQVRFAVPVAVPHTGSEGEALTSWLYLPTRPAEGPFPLVVLTYPGLATTAQRDPAEFATQLNLQQLTAAGYAVLTPSVVRPFHPAEPASGLADQVLAVVDAALALHPELDGGRLIYWGQSFGGYGGLVVATQTDRFRSIIVSASMSNMAAKWGEFAPWNRADPRWGISMRHAAGWTEQSQGAMGGPPWSDSDRYVRNSPLFQADRIRTPILIMHGERDMALGDAESLYSALWRQNKDVRFITWWGEGHTVESPANLREMYRQILGWLDETAGPTPAAPTSLARSSGEASSRPGRPSSDDGSRPPTSGGPGRAKPLSAHGR